MENIFSNYALNYYEKKLLVTPIRQQSKAPILPKWQNPETYTNYQGIIDKYPTCGIGLLLGESTGIIAVDIDKESAMNLVPPSPVRKKGSKGETRFFRYNGETSRKRHDLGIELLSTGNQTILPPSLHPEGRTYAWVTPDTLLDINVNELPYLDDKFKKQFEIQSIKTETITKSNGSRCNHGSHTKLSEMLVAAIHSSETPEHIVKNLLEFDSKANPEVSYFVCPSRPWRTKDRNLNAYSFVLEGFARHIKNNEIETIPLEEVQVVVNLEKKKEEVKRKPIPHLRVMGSTMFEHLAKNSRVRRSNYFFASIISTVSVLLGNKVRMGKNWTNLYCMVIGNSGYGKSSALDFPKEVLPVNLIGVAMPSSDTGLIQQLPRQRTRLDVVDEGDNLFETVLSKNAYGKKMAATYAELFSSRGKIFKGKEIGVGSREKDATGNIGGCYSPCVSTLVNMTTVGFNHYITQSLIDSGFLARFLYFFDTEKKRQNYQGSYEEPSKEIKDFIDMWSSEEGINLNKDPFYKFNVYDIPKTEEAERELRKAHEIIEDIREKEPEDSKTYSLINRAMENLEKLAIIDCALTNPKTKKLVMTHESIKWALEVILVQIHNTRIALGAHINEGSRASLYDKILGFINQHDREVKLSEIGEKFKNCYSSLRKEILSDLYDSGKVRSRKEGRTVFYSKN